MVRDCTFQVLFSSLSSLISCYFCLAISTPPYLIIKSKHTSRSGYKTTGAHIISGSFLVEARKVRRPVKAWPSPAQQPKEEDSLFTLHREFFSHMAWRKFIIIIFLSNKQFFADWFLCNSTNSACENQLRILITAPRMVWPHNLHLLGYTTQSFSVLWLLGQIRKDRGKGCCFHFSVTSPSWGQEFSFLSETDLGKPWTVFYLLLCCKSRQVSSIPPASAEWQPAVSALL